MSHFHLLEGPQICLIFYFYFFHCVENEKIVSFKFFRPKITHSFVLDWNFERNPVETPKEMSDFHLLEWPQICMSFFFYYFFHSVENEKIVSFKFFRPKITRSFVLGWNFKRNPVETPNEMPHFHVLEGPQIWMTFYFYFFHSLDMDIIVSFKFFRPKITHSFVLDWNFKRNPVETPKEMSDFHLLEWPQICMSFYFYFFHSVENEKIVSLKFFRPKIIHSFVVGWNFKRNPVETPNEMPHFHVLEGPQIWMTFYFYFFHSIDVDIIVSFKFFRPKNIHSYIHVWNFKRNPLKPQKKCRIFIYLKCRKFVCLIILIFFIA
jgi:hypothetical protein